MKVGEQGAAQLFLFSYLFLGGWIQAYSVEIYLWLVRTQVKNRIAIVRHYSIVLRECVMFCCLFQIFTRFFAKIIGYDDPEFIVASNFVIINFDRFINLAQRHVYLN